MRQNCCKDKHLFNIKHKTSLFFSIFDIFTSALGHKDLFAEKTSHFTTGI